MTQSTHQGPAARRSNPAGIASLVAGVVMIVVAAGVQSVSVALPMLSLRFDLPMWMISAVTVAPTALVALITVILGLVGLLQRERARTAAIIGATLGASQLIVLITGAIGRMVVVAVLG